MITIDRPLWQHYVHQADLLTSRMLKLHGVLASFSEPLLIKLMLPFEISHKSSSCRGRHGGKAKEITLCHKIFRHR